MIRSLGIALIALMLTASACQTPEPPGGDDVAALRDLPVRFSEAWARHDGAALGMLMSDDVDFVNVGAIWLSGRADFTLYHSRILAGRFRNSTNVPLEIHVEPLRRDLAIVRWSWRIDGETDAAGGALPTRYGLMSMLAEERDGRWLVIAAQNTNSGPARPEADGIRSPIAVPRT
jgi:uncharacterized protein (TIGR02246 family)